MVDTKTACTLLPYSILNLIKVDITYLRTVILTASTVGACWLWSIAIAMCSYAAEALAGAERHRPIAATAAVGQCRH